MDRHSITYTYGTNVFYWVAGVEDAENWHGKPMPKERADAIIKLIESQIQTNKNLDPKPPIEDSPQVNITDIEMSSPPAYKVGEQVGKLYCSHFFKIRNRTLHVFSSPWMNQLLDCMTCNLKVISNRGEFSIFYYFFKFI